MTVERLRIARQVLFQVASSATPKPSGLQLGAQMSPPRALTIQMGRAPT